MTARRHPVHHVHSSWPAPITGLIAAFLFAAVLIVYAVLLFVRG